MSGFLAHVCQSKASIVQRAMLPKEAPFVRRSCYLAMEEDGNNQQYHLSLNINQPITVTKSAMIYHLAVNPPSTATQVPVIQLASSLANTTAILAISLGFPGPLNGYIFCISDGGIVFFVVSVKMAVSMSGWMGC